jgi:hypothetical protein
MNPQQHPYTVEYEDNHGVIYYELITADSIGDARGQVQNSRPEVHIRAVTLNPIAAP